MGISKESIRTGIDRSLRGVAIGLAVAGCAGNPAEQRTTGTNTLEPTRRPPTAFPTLPPTYVATLISPSATPDTIGVNEGLGGAYSEYVLAHPKYIEESLKAAAVEKVTGSHWDPAVLEIRDSDNKLVDLHISGSLFRKDGGGVLVLTEVGMKEFDEFEDGQYSAGFAIKVEDGNVLLKVWNLRFDEEGGSYVRGEIDLETGEYKPFGYEIGNGLGREGVIVLWQNNDGTYSAKPVPAVPATETPELEISKEIRHQWGNVVITSDPKLVRIKDLNRNLPDIENRLNQTVDLTIAHAMLSSGKDDYFLLFDPFMASGIRRDLDETPILAFRERMAQENLEGVEGALKLIGYMREEGNLPFPVFTSSRAEESTNVNLALPIEFKFVSLPKGHVELIFSPYISMKVVKRNDGGLTIEVYGGTKPERPDGAFILALAGMVCTKAQVGKNPDPNFLREKYPWIIALRTDQQGNYLPVFSYEDEP